MASLDMLAPVIDPKLSGKKLQRKKRMAMRIIFQIAMACCRPSADKSFSIKKMRFSRQTSKA